MAQANQDLLGSTCLSKRSIDLVHRLLLPLPAATSQTPVSRGDVNGLIAFLNTLALSKSLSYDGTLPRNQIEAIESSIGELRDRSGSQLQFGAVTYENFDQIYPTLLEIAAHLNVQLSKFDLLSGCDNPLDGHDRFKSEIEKAARDLASGSKEKVTSTSREIAAELFSENVRFIGSKCVAALVSGGPPLLNKALSLYAKFDDQSRISGALINRFRLLYVARLAGLRSSTHQPDTTLHPLTEKSYSTFIEYLASALIKKAPGFNSGAFWRFFAPESPPPPVGLLILARVTTRRGHAHELIAEALNFRDRYGTLIEQSAAFPRQRLVALRNDFVKDVYDREISEMEEQIGAWSRHIRLRSRVFIPFEKILSNRFLPPIAEGALHLLHEITKVEIRVEQLEAAIENLKSYFEIQAEIPNDFILEYYNFKREFVLDESTKKFIAGPITQLLRSAHR